MIEKPQDDSPKKSCINAVLSTDFSKALGCLVYDLLIEKLQAYGIELFS